MMVTVIMYSSQVQFQTQTTVSINRYHKQQLNLLAYLGLLFLMVDCHDDFITLRLHSADFIW